MELSSQDHGEIPIPINSTYGGHIIHHNPPPPPLPLPTPPPQNHNIVTNLVPQISTNGPLEDPKKSVKYRECLKNHAASLGGNATDGCGEFMPGGEEGSIEAFTCSVCNCHRNFHRKEIDGHQHYHSSSCDCYQHLNLNNRSGIGRKLILGHHFGTPQYPATTATALVPSRPAQPHQMIMSSYNNMMASLPSDQSDEQEDANNNNHHNGSAGVLTARPPQLLRKRFRTKFSQEQKEKMLNFAEKVGWKIQKQEEAVVQQFCQEVGVKRRVLKVWMHNNKHILAKKNSTSSTPTLQNPVD